MIRRAECEMYTMPHYREWKLRGVLYTKPGKNDSAVSHNKSCGVSTKPKGSA